MTTIRIGELVATVAEALIAATEASSPPDVTLANSRELSRNMPGVNVRVLWERESAAERWHYDFLLELADGGVMTLGYVGPGGVPFPLRSVQKVSDGDLLRVNGRSLAVGVAMALLDFMWNREDILNQLIDRMIIQEWIERLDIEVGDHELQVAADEWRMDKGLLSAEETHAWLERAGISVLRFEHMVGDEVAGRKLRDQVVGDRLEPTQPSVPSQAGRLEVSWFAVHLADAECLDAETELETPRDLFDKAMDLSRCGCLAASGFFADPGDLPTAIADAPAAARRGEVGTRQVTRDGRIYIYHAACDAPLSEEEKVVELTERLFADWLARLRSEAKVEWFWGDEP